MTPEFAGTNQIYNEWGLSLRLFGRQFGLAAGQFATSAARRRNYRDCKPFTL